MKELAITVIVIALAVPVTILAFCLVWGAAAWLAERSGVGDWGQLWEEEDWW